MIAIEITQRNFELCRNRIALILRNELANQEYISTDNLFIKPAVYIEGSEPFNHTDLPIINVTLASGDFGNKDVQKSDGTYLYNIDCYSKAKTTATQSGDTLAALRLQRILGVVQAVFDNPIYRTLGFVPPSITRVTVKSFNIADVTKGDSLSIIKGRVQIEVVAPENNSLINANLIDGYITNVKLYLTDKGYIFSEFETDTNTGALLLGSGARLLLGTNGAILLG